MKQAITIILFCSGILLSSCRKSVEAPDCIRSAIEAYGNNPNWQTEKVDEYLFQGKLVYLFIDDNRIADGGISVVDGECNTVCFLGGIAGLTMCNGDKFFEKAVFKRTVWKR